MSTVREAPDSLEEWYEYALARGWGDGLPLIPPTEDRVAAMVAASGRPAGELIAHLDPVGGAATVEKVAINAVMAGCLPSYLPVLLAAIEALAMPPFNLHGVQTTTNPVGPAVIVNGPVRHQIGINCGRGLLGPGWRANATIGRAVRLCMINIGGAAPGTVDMALQGMPGKYTFCFGEDEERSPWSPLHVELGFPANTSVVTCVGVNANAGVIADYKKAERVLRTVADALAQGIANAALFESGTLLVIMSYGHARLLHNQGFDKRRVKEWLYEHAKVPQERFAGMTRVHSELREGSPVSVTAGPDDIALVVGGGDEPYQITVCSTFGPTNMTSAAVRDTGSSS